MSCNCQSTPCCCPNWTTTTTTYSCEGGSLCDIVYSTDCVIYNGEQVVFGDCLTINPGDTYTTILEGIISNLAQCTTTTTVAPGWYIKDAEVSTNNGDLVLFNYGDRVPVFNPNLLNGICDVILVIKIYDINGNAVPDLTQLPGNSGTLTLTQGSNSVVYSFNSAAFTYNSFTQCIGGLDYVMLVTPATADFNLVDPIQISVTIV